MREPFAHPVGGATGFVGREMASRNRGSSPRSGRHAAFWARAHMNALRVIPPTERDVLEKSQRARVPDRGPDPGPQGNPRGDAMDLVFSQAFAFERSQRAPEKSAEPCHGADLGSLCRGRNIANTHVINHALARRDRRGDRRIRPRGARGARQRPRGQGHSS
jgi:hypothetical protein